MDGGYVLVHVLEAVVPGHDLGENPTCEASLGECRAQHPVPSTSEGENILLPVPPTDGDHMIHVHVFDSARRGVGLVVIPISSLAPLEVWNVWYAMSEDGDEERPPEEMAKMHILLQYINREVSVEENSQVREMRSQDFLLRALQQLNADLEAKVMNSGGVSDLPTTNEGPSQGADSVPSATSSPSQKGPDRAGSGEKRAAPSGTTAAALHSEFEELLRRRVEPYKQMLQACQQKQKFYDDQDAQMKKVTQALEQQERKAHELYTKLYEATRKSAAELAQERDNIRASEEERRALEIKNVDLQQEVNLRKAHEESLEKRVALMEHELSVVHQKCILMDTVEENARRSKMEATSHLEARIAVEKKLEEQTSHIGRIHEDVKKVAEEHRQEIEKLSTRLLAEKQSAELLHHTLADYQDIIRDKDAERKLLMEKIEALTRGTVSLENEVASFRNMLEREKDHCTEVEERLVTEAKALIETKEAHAKVMQELQDDNAQLKQRVQDEQNRSAALEVDLAGFKADVEKEKNEKFVLSKQIQIQSELNTMVQQFQGQNAEFKEKVEKLLKENKKITEHYDHELSECNRSIQSLIGDRDSKARTVAQLSSNLTEAHLQSRELTLLQEQTVKNLNQVKETAQQCEDFQQQLVQTQAEFKESHAAREQMHQEIGRVAADFQEHVSSAEIRVAELEKLLGNRNNEIKLLMYRVQELSSKYVPVKGDVVDSVLAKWIQGYKPAVPFFRLSQGLYLFGRRQVICKISNDKPVFRVGGGFIGFDKFLELYAHEELERLLNYEMDERTNTPKFSETLKIKHQMEQLGVVEEEKDRVHRSVPVLDPNSSEMRALPPSVQSDRLNQMVSGSAAPLRRR